MQFKRPKNSDKYYWTEHCVFKLKQYGLSAQRITRIIKSPHRKENGIVNNTVAVMQPTSFKRDKEGKRTWSSEIWAMYQLRKAQKFKVESLKLKGGVNSEKLDRKLQMQNTQYKIISAWRYPGVSPKNNPIPEEIFEELENIQ